MRRVQRLADQLGHVTEQFAQAKQLTDDLQKKQEYSNVARYGATGLLGWAGVGLKENSPLNKILGPYLHDDPNNFHWDCTPEAITAYTEAIKSERKFPFPYYYRATCNKANNAGDWQRDVEIARNTLLITTQIPGHHVNHDEILEFIDAGRGL